MYGCDTIKDASEATISKYFKSNRLHFRQPHFLLPRVSGNNLWWITSIRKQMIQKRKKSLNNCRYHTMSGIPTGLHVRHSLHIQNLSRGVYILHILNRWTVLTFFNLNHSCSSFICVCGFFSFCDRISILSSHSTKVVLNITKHDSKCIDEFLILR